MAPLTVTMNEQGRIVIPAQARKDLGLKPGMKLVVTIEDGGLRLADARANMRRVQRILRERHPDPDDPIWTYDLIAERRRDARRAAEQVDG